MHMAFYMRHLLIFFIFSLVFAATPKEFASHIKEKLDNLCIWRDNSVSCDLEQQMTHGGQMHVLEFASSQTHSTTHWGRSCNGRFFGIQYAFITLKDVPFDPSYSNMRDFNRAVYQYLYEESLCGTEILITTLSDTEKVFVYRPPSVTRVLSEHTMSRMEEQMKDGLEVKNFVGAYKDVLRFMDGFMNNRSLTLLHDWSSCVVLFLVMSVLFSIAWILWLREIFVFTEGDMADDYQLMMMAAHKHAIQQEVADYLPQRKKKTASLDSLIIV
eukprot:GDKJ01026171.1.p1 GENE.GDKJ01026171.1~~GDKJ01026171.1.p1  ORF type:complete len:271 (+),score=43.07 GDKJ01026171.1:3-815(+)